MNMDGSNWNLTSSHPEDSCLNVFLHGNRTILILRDLNWYPQDRKPYDPVVAQELFDIAFLQTGPASQSHLRDYVNPPPYVRQRLGLGTNLPALYRRGQDPEVESYQRPLYDLMSLILPILVFLQLERWKL